MTPNINRPSQPPVYQSARESDQPVKQVTSGEEVQVDFSKLHTMSKSVSATKSEEDSSSIVEVNSDDSSDASSEFSIEVDGSAPPAAAPASIPAQTAPALSKRKQLEEKIMRPETRKLQQEFLALEADSKKALIASPYKKASHLLSGAVSQGTGFAIGAPLAKAAGNFWLFPLFTSVLNELVSDKGAAMIRKTTFSTPDFKKLNYQQRLIGRITGDLIRECFGIPCKRKYEIKDADGKTIRVTAREALSKEESYFFVSGRNYLVRALPYIWFTMIYIGRDGLNNHVWPLAAKNFELNQSALETSTTVISGLFSGALTMLTSQAIAARMPGTTETPNFGTDYWVKKKAYLEALDIDRRDYVFALDTNAPDYEEEKQKTMDLRTAISKDLEMATLRSSTLGTYGAELKTAFKKKRDATSIDPEFAGSRVETGINIIGKLISLLAFTYFTIEMDKHKSDNNPLLQAETYFALPVILIFLGFALRDELRLVGRVGYGAIKGARDGISHAMTQYRGSEGQLTPTASSIRQTESSNSQSRNDRGGEASSSELV